jgi:filamentous hemagglutinin family protein
VILFPLPTAQLAERPHAARLLALAAGACLMSAGLAAHAQIQPSGATPTNVATGANGRQIITPAAPKNDVSYNAFSRFDVTAAGATFANAEVRARTIVGEVFSPLPSRIEGPVAVDGPRANLILANQNGIRVNGGSFVNFGSLALTTGEVTLRDVQLTPDATQRYVDLRTRQGDIQIEAGGLDANVVRLELNAKKIGIGGPITNAFTSATALTRLVPGNSDASFDTQASPTDNLTPWLTYKAQPADVPAVSGIALDITAGSSIRSGRVEIIVTDQGAGVRNAGTLSATAGDFRLTATGQVEQAGGRIESVGDIRVRAKDFHQFSEGARQSAVVAGASLRIDTEHAIRNDGGVIQGQTRSGVDADTPYAVFLNAGTTVEIATPVMAKEGAVVFGGADDVMIRGQQGIRIANARIVSNGQLRVQSKGALSVDSLHVDGAARKDWSSGNWLRRKDGFVVDRGALADADHQAYLVSEGDMTIRVGSVQNNGGTMFSNAGRLDVEAATDVTNRALAVGSFDFSKRCVLFICRQKAQSTEALVGGQVSAGTTLRIKAGGTILNEGGQFLSIGDQEIDGAQNIARAIPIQQALVRADGLKALFGDTWARLYATDQGGGFTSQQGKLIFRGATRQEGGIFAARDGVEGAIEVVRLPQRTPVTLEDHLGIFR